MKIKKHIARIEKKEFINRYNLVDGIMKPKTDVRFNPYEGTNLLLLDELIASGVINKTDKILDVGAGAGLTLIYLAENGFQKLQGVELDSELANLFKSNLAKYLSKSEYKYEIQVLECNALDLNIDDDVSVFYLFNTFYDKETYLCWLQNVKESLERNRRKIKILILYPTVASMGAMRECDWLEEKGRILCEAQICYRCVNYIIYESV